MADRKRKMAEHEENYAAQQLWIRGTSDAVDIFVSFKVFQTRRRSAGSIPLISSPV